jgi:hypothetical protein
MQKLTINEKRVYREVALPVSAFDALQRLKRAWDVRTNAEVLTLLLLNADREMMKNDEEEASSPDRTP